MKAKDYFEENAPITVTILKEWKGIGKGEVFNSVTTHADAFATEEKKTFAESIRRELKANALKDKVTVHDIDTIINDKLKQLK